MLWALMLSLSMANQAVSGVVKDTSGGVVQGAMVIVQTASGTAQTVKASSKLLSEGPERAIS